MGTVLLDRDVELELLNRRLASIRMGDGRVVVVEGPAGIGKSSLLAALARTAQRQGFTTVVARGGPLEQDAVWGVARQMFEPIRVRDDWEALTRGAASLAARALDAATPEPALAGDAMHAAVHGLVWLACNLAERRPVLLVVDDVHWADAASLRWLAVLSRRLDELPLGVLCAVRTGEPPGAPEELAELLAAASEPSVRPRPLGICAAEVIVRDRLPGADASFAHACHAVTAGNPFLLGSLIGHLVSDQISPDEHTANQLTEFGTAQISRSVQRQLARLPNGADGLAGALAVLGRGASLRHAARLTGRTLSETADLADALRNAGLAQGPPELALTHPLIASSLYANLGSACRARMHAEAAQLLSDEGADPEQVALHLLRTEPQGDAQVVAVLRAAAREATTRGAPESAATLLRRAIAEPPDRASAASVHLELGLARAARWQTDAYNLLSDAIALAQSPSERAAIALPGARALGLAGDFGAALDLCRQGLGDSVGVPSAQRERLEAELVCNGMLRAQRPSEMTRLFAVARNGPSLGLSAVNLALQAMLSGEPAAAVHDLLGPILADGVLDAEMDSIVPTAAAVVMVVDDALEDAIAWCGRLIDVARPRGWLIALAHGSWVRSMALVRAGRIRSAEPDARLALEFKLGNTTPEALTWALHTVVDVLTEADRLEDAEAALALADQAGEPPLGALGSPLLLQSRARLRLAQHRPEAAYADADAARVRCEELSVFHPGFASWRVEAAEALTALGERKRAVVLAQEHLRLADRLGNPAPKAAGLCALARAGDPADRVPLLVRAVELAASSPARLEQVRVQVALGAALRRGNQRAEARIPLRSALDLADRHGMRLLASRARSELDAAGARPRRPASTGPQALTPAEHRIASLAGDGCSNRDIAGQLYVTRRTVETHLTHAFQKLGISSRTELGDVLHVPQGHGAQAGA